MAKISAIPAMVLVLFLAMSVGTWAKQSWFEWKQKGLGRVQRNEMDESGGETEAEVEAFLNVLEGAETALEADKFQTALAMVAGVIARLDATNFPDHEKAAKLKELLPVIEDAVEHDNKVKAIAFIKTLEQEFNHRTQGGGGGGIQKRGLLDLEQEQRMKQAMADDLREAFEAIEAEQKDKAEAMLSKIYEVLKDNPHFGEEQKAVVFLKAIHEVEMLVREDAKDKAEQVLQGAAFAIGIQNLHEEINAGSRVSVKEGEEESDDQFDPNASPEIKMEKLRAYFEKGMTAVIANKKEKAEDYLGKAVDVLNKEKGIIKDEQGANKLTETIHQAMSYVKQGRMDKAKDVLVSALEDAAKLLTFEEEGTAEEKMKKKTDKMLSYSQQGLDAIKKEQKGEAENYLSAVYWMIKQDGTLSQHEQATKYMQEIEKTLKHVKDGAFDKAQEIFEAAFKEAGSSKVTAEQENKGTATGKTEPVPRSRKTASHGAEL